VLDDVLRIVAAPGIPRQAPVRPPPNGRQRPLEEKTSGGFVAAARALQHVQRRIAWGNVFRRSVRPSHDAIDRRRFCPGHLANRETIHYCAPQRRRTRQLPSSDRLDVM